ncbi:MAG: CBS domain-containing protein [Halobacterium sp.]
MTRLALRDVMTHDFVGVSEGDGLLDAVELMRAENATSAVVLRGSDPVGVVTTETVMDLLLDREDLASVSVSDVMESTPESLPADASIAQAADVMGRTGNPRVLVTDEDGVRGIVEARDVAPAVTDRTEHAQNPGSDVESRGVAVEEASANHADEYAEGSGPNDYAEQGVCESCGSLASELVNVNGRLLCTECRSV